MGRALGKLFRSLHLLRMLRFLVREVQRGNPYVIGGLALVVFLLGAGWMIARRRHQNAEVERAFADDPAPQPETFGPEA